MIKFSVVIISMFFLGACASNQAVETTDVKAKAVTAKKGEKRVETAKKGGVKCSLPKDERLIEVKKSGSGCEVMYTKFGKTNSVAQSAFGVAHCEKVQNRMKDKLSSAGFSCM